MAFWLPCLRLEQSASSSALPRLVSAWVSWKLPHPQHWTHIQANTCCNEYCSEWWLVLNMPSHQYPFQTYWFIYCLIIDWLTDWLCMYSEMKSRCYTYCRHELRRQVKSEIQVFFKWFSDFADLQLHVLLIACCAYRVEHIVSAMTFLMGERYFKL